MVAYDDMSDYARLKHGTRRIQKFLVDTTEESLGRDDWIDKFHVDPETPTGNMRIAVFKECGEIIANDPIKVTLIPSHVLHYLKDMIPLRDAEIQMWEPLTKYDTKIQLAREKHISFNTVLKAVFRMFKIALTRHRHRLREQFSTRAESLEPIPQLSDNPNLDRTDGTEEETEEVEEVDDGGVIESGLASDTLDMDVSAAEIESDDIAIILSLLLLLLLLLAVQQDVGDVWEDNCANNISPAASGVITGFAYHIIKAEVSKTEITNQIPTVQLTGCSD
jgi:hypothetical protein